MTGHFHHEFLTVDAVLASGGVTARVDAVALCWLKAERQMRKLLTNAVFQSQGFNYTHIPALREVLAGKRSIYFQHCMLGYERIIERPLSNLIGPAYPELGNEMSTFAAHRNKLFHGQLTAARLNEFELDRAIGNIRRWCEKLADAAQNSYGYDGFGRNSFRKTAPKPLPNELQNVAEYDAFLTGLVRELKV